MFKKIKLIISFILLCSFGVIAQTLTASISSDKVGLNDQFQLSFTFEGTDINSVRNFTPPSFDKFFVLSGPNQSTSVQIINGAVSGSLAFSYYLRPKGLGKYTIAAASVNFQGKEIKSKPINIEIIKGSTQKKNVTNNNQANISNQDIAENLFVKAFVNKTKVYLGEQVTVTYKLYTRLNIASQMSISKLPQYKGFWSEELNTSNNINFTTEEVEGKRYKVGILKKAALFPSEFGNLTITPFELNVPIRIKNQQRKGNIFDDFFNDPFDQGQIINYAAKSNAVKLTVLPLPNNNVPASFKGIVGNYTMSTSINKTDIETNETVTIKIDIKGTGNLKLLNIPELEIPNGLDKYDPKITDRISRNNIISGEKNAEYVIVPRIPGKKEIKPVAFSFFDPDKRQYRTLTSDSFTLNVSPGKNITSNTLTGITKEDIKLLGEDIRFIKTSSANLFKKQETVILTYKFWAMTIIPFIIFLTFLSWQKKQNKLAGDLRLLKYNKAQKIAKTRLKTAKKLLSDKDQNSFYSELSLALFGYLEDKLHLPKAEFSMDKAEQLLINKGVNIELIGELKACTEKCEFIRFAPEKGGIEEMNELFKKSTNIIVNIERELSQKINR